jgi:hypothetical protein
MILLANKSITKAISVSEPIKEATSLCYPHNCRVFLCALIHTTIKNLQLVQIPKSLFSFLNEDNWTGSNYSTRFGGLGILNGYGDLVI